MEAGPPTCAKPGKSRVKPKGATAVDPSSAYPHIEAIIRGGVQVMIGTVKPIKGAAVAHDGKKTLAMLRYGPR